MMIRLKEQQQQTIKQLAQELKSYLPLGESDFQESCMNTKAVCL